MANPQHDAADGPAHLRARARAWLADDPDSGTRAELAELLDSAFPHGTSLDDATPNTAMPDGATFGEPESAALAELADRFGSELSFGTAGLRGEMAAGPNRMNRVVVIRAAAGLAAYLLERGGRRVVVGYDARHLSATFALDTCSVLTAAGIEACLLPGALPTPVLAFAIRHLDADAGVMVTASHNPARDNGYKVYLGDGAQIVPPADGDIAAAIAAVGPSATVARAETGWTQLGNEVVDAYVARAAAAVAPDTPRELSVAYTPLHGVGRAVALAVFARAGFAEPRVVTAQAAPDPDFPGLPYPNPEAPGALNLAIDLAERIGADVALANDPDADRLGAALPFPDGWRPLRGDEVGGLLAAHLTRTEAAGQAEDVLACSIVSSSLLGRIAAARGLRYARTLTGFKWIARVPNLRFGYEEALGFCVDPEAVKDKDGITAALLLAESAAVLKAEGRSLVDVLDDLAREFGVHLTTQLTIRLREPAEGPDLVRRLLERPPLLLGGLVLRRVDDLGTGLDDLPPTPGLRYRLDRDAWVVARPSGTEPLLKCYIEVVEPMKPPDGHDPAPARQRAADLMAAITTDLAKLLDPTRGSQ